MLIDFLVQPLIIPIWSALVGVVIAFAGQRLWDKRKYKNERRAAFRILKKELDNHKRLLVEMETLLKDEKDYIIASIDPGSIEKFLSSNFVQINKDSELIVKLHEHIQNISLLKHAIYRIDLNSTGWTQPQAEKKKSLEENLAGQLKELIQIVGSCIQLLEA